MLFGSHIFENHGKPSNVNNFELHPTSTDKASTAPLEATRTLCPTAVFGARQESVAVPAAVCPKGADVTMYNDVHNTVNVCWIWRCWLGRVFCILLFTSENREMNRNCLNCHSLCVFFEPQLNENGTEKDPFGRENNTRLRRGVALSWDLCHQVQSPSRPPELGRPMVNKWNREDQGGMKPTETNKIVEKNEGLGVRVLTSSKPKVSFIWGLDQALFRSALWFRPFLASTTAHQGSTRSEEQKFVTLRPELPRVASLRQKIGDQWHPMTRTFQQIPNDYAIASASNLNSILGWLFYA